MVAGGSEQGRVIFWDIRKPEKAVSIFHETQTDDVLSVHFRGKLLASASEDDSIVVYDLARSEPEPLEVMLNLEHPACKTGIDDQGRVLFETLDNHFGCYSLETGMKIKSSFYENSDEDKSKYFLKTNIDDLLFRDKKELQFFSVENGFVKEQGFDSESDFLASYELASDAMLRDALKLEENLLVISDDGFLRLAKEKVMNVEDLAKGYFAD